MAGTDITLFDAAGGLDAMRRLSAAWHARAVADHQVGHAFSHGFKADHVERLAAYLAEALGGPPLYTSRYGSESDVVRLHSGNGEHDDMNTAAIACFDGAIRDALPHASDQLRDALHDYWTWSTLGPMYRYHGTDEAIPGDLRITRWGWDGVVDE